MAKVLVSVALAVVVCSQTGARGDARDTETRTFAVPLTSAFAGQARSAGTLPSTPPADLPSYPFEGVPGWLAFATTPQWRDEPYGWSPVSASNHVALFADDLRPWEATPTGRRFVGVGTSGTDPLVFSGVGRHKYGCDNNTEEMATFSGRPMAEGPVWLLPAGATGVVSVPITVTSGAGADAIGAWSRVPPSVRDEARKAIAARAYMAGRVSVAQYATGKIAVKTVVVVDGRVTSERIDTKYSMGGSTPDSVDLNSRGHSDMGIPQPIGAFRFGAEWPFVIVLWNRAYEGNRFNVLRVDAAGARLIDGPYVYYCAF